MRQIFKNWRKKKKEKTCQECGKNKTYINKKRKYEEWYKHPNGWKCKNCYNKKYIQRAEVKKKRKEYGQRPEVKKKIRERNQRPEIIKRRKEYEQKYKERPEVKKRRKEINKAYHIKQNYLKKLPPEQLIQYVNQNNKGELK